MSIRRSLLRRAFAAGVLASLAGCVAWPYAADSKQRSDALLQAQMARAHQALVLAAGRPPHVVFAGFALNSESRAFRGDVQLGEQVMRGIDPQAVVFTLANPAFGQDAEWPFATRENVQAVLESIGAEAGPDDKVVLLFASHGAPHILALRAANRDLGTITPEDLQQWLGPLRGKPTLIVLSACYSGSFMPALRDRSRIILTAAAADRNSFGCQFHSNNTYFVEELLGGPDPGSLSLRQLMDRAGEGVQRREQALKVTPSRPQWFFGAAVQQWGAQPLSQWLQKAAS